MKNNVRFERTLKKITQENLANTVGVSRQTINAIESNKIVPSALLAMKIARTLEKKVEELFLLEEYD
jgi:putative transcriptional regulator